MGQFLDKTGLGTLWTKIKNTFAAKTDLDAYATKESLNNYSTQANVNARIQEALNGFGDYCDDTYATKDEIVAVMHYKGTKASYSALPTTDNVLGDVWNVTDTGKNYAWNGTSWDELSGVTDLSAYLTKTEAGNTYAVKTDLDAYLTKNAAGNTYVPKSSSSSEAQANITNENGEVSITSAESGVSVVPEGAALFSATQDGMNVLSVNDEGAFMNDNQLLDSSMALTETEINNICK